MSKANNNNAAKSTKEAETIQSIRAKATPIKRGEEQAKENKDKEEKRK